jgi:hypothetical protein
MDSVLGVTEDLRTLYPRLIDGDMSVVAAFVDKATADSPLGCKQQPAEFASETRAWLQHHTARSEQVHTIVTPERVIHELTLHLTLDGEGREVPVMLIADVETGRRRRRTRSSSPTAAFANPPAGRGRTAARPGRSGTRTS